MNIHVQVSDDPGARIAELEAQARNTQVAFDAVAQGVCLFDRDRRLIAANRSFAAIHRLAPEALRPGAALSEVAEALQAAGTCPMAVDDYVAYCRAIQSRGEPRVWCVTLADGRVLRVRQEPTPDGGWVAIHADVSEARETRRLREACATMQALIDRVPGHLWVKDCDSRFVFANQTLATDYGRGAVADLVGLSDFDFRAPEAAKERRRRELGVILAGDSIINHEEILVAASGETKRFQSTTTTLRDADGRIAGLVGVELEAAALKASEAPADELDILDMVASGAPASATLGALLGLIEAQSRGVVASALRLDPGGERLRYAAQSNLPETLQAATEGLRLDSAAPAFAEAVLRRAPSVSVDFAGDPNWAGLGGLAAASGFSACWATPILAKDDEPLGVFAVYAREPRAPSAAEARRARVASRLAAIAIERELSAAALARAKLML
ncbi:MAG: PAS-domain containing protein [Roseiarcus sp.]